MTNAPDSLEEAMANQAQSEGTSYNARIIEEFRANGGRVGGEWEGTELILIHHIGARSGIERVTPVGCFHLGKPRRSRSTAGDR
jgi:F420H(2)-dependent quinone reductase